MGKVHYVVTAVGENRTGIVADISEVIFHSGCNIEDSQMSLLGDQFALLTLVSSPGDDDSRALLDGCDQLQRTKELQVAVFPVGERWPDCYQAKQSVNYELKVVGQDRAGIVCRTSRVLSQYGIDILDLKAKIIRAPESGIPIFNMKAELSVPGTADVEAMRLSLKVLADEMVVDMSLKALGSASH